MTVRAIAWAVALLLGSASATAADAGLIAAAKRGDVAAVRAALARGVDAGAADIDGTTALHWASYRNEVEIAELLLHAGARAQAANRYGVRPLSLACANRHSGLVERLLRAGADANAARDDGETPLMTAGRAGIVESVKLLVAHGANVNAREPWRDQTALMWAAAEGHSGVIRTLVEAGADIRARSRSGFTPLLFAAREGHLDAVRTLLDSGASLGESLSVNSIESAGGVTRGKDEPSLNAFLLASGNAHFELAAFLLDRGADPNAAPRGWTALHQVSWLRKMGEAGGNNPPPAGSGGMGSLDFVRKLVAAGAHVNRRVTSRRLPVGSSTLNFAGATPFLLAARTADIELMRLLLELGADHRLPTELQTTPLMVAAGVGAALPGEEPGTESEALAVVKWLIDLGADVNAVDDTGNTAMHGAAYKHLPAIVTLLSGAGAKVDIWDQKNRDAHTPLEIAAGIQRGMNFVYSRETESAIRAAMKRGR